MSETLPLPGPANDMLLAAPLLTTKLYIPQVRADLVPRPRLIERLNEGLGRRLTLVCAPAGFGKTTLLAEWVRSPAGALPAAVGETRRRPGVANAARGRGGEAAGIGAEIRTGDDTLRLRGGGAPRASIAWLSLDEGDNDPVRFWGHVIAALQTARPGVGTAAQRLLRSPQPPATASLLAALINELAALSGDVVLVLDDYHLIEAPAIHQALAYLLDHLPPQMHVVVASRTEVPLPLARLRARGLLVELRTDDLRFTPEEAAAFLTRVGAALSTDDVATLAARTEGWITGLQLAVLSLRDREDAASFVQSFAGDDRYILEYLMEEVLQRQPEHVHTFLLETSILDRLCGPLCDAVTGRDDSQAVLEGLESANLFTVALDSRRRWYRYHRLFADLLRHRLGQAQPGRVAELHRRACDWYERNALPTRAIPHALAAGDVNRAADLIEGLTRTGATTPVHTEANTMLRWLQELPDDMVRRRPLVAVACAWALAGTGRLGAAEARLLEAEAALSQPSGDGPAMVGELDRWLGHVDALRANLASAQGDMPRVLVLSRRALRRLPEGDLPARSLVALSLGRAHAFGQRVDVSEATRAFEEAIAIGQAAGDIGIALTAMGNLAGMQTRSGRLRQAAETYRRAFDLAGEHGKGPYLPLGGIHLNYGELLREWNDLDEAEQHLSVGIELCKQGGRLVDLVLGYVFQARVRGGRGDWHGALATIQKALLLVEGTLEASRRSGRPEQEALAWLAGEVAENRAWLWLSQGNLEAAARWAQERGFTTSVDGEAASSSEYATFARLLIAEGRPGEALLLLERLLAAAEAAAEVWRALHVRALQAMASQAAGDMPAALALLERALAIAEPEGYVRTFADKGPRMAALLQEWRTRKARGLREARSQPRADSMAERALLVYADRLLAACGPKLQTGRPGPTVPSVPSVASALTEPLSKRELEVLRLMASGLSNQEIADQLIVAIGTVKKHGHNIYGKLGVRSRTQAVVRARELGVL